MEERMTGKLTSLDRFKKERKKEKVEQPTRSRKSQHLSMLNLLNAAQNNYRKISSLTKIETYLSRGVSLCQRVHV